MVTNEDFNNLLESRIRKMRATITAKNAEYSPGADRLKNFKDAARFNADYPGDTARALWGMIVKHLAYVLMMVNGDGAEDEATIDEKIGDTINYLFLLEAVFRERNNGEPAGPQ